MSVAHHLLTAGRSSRARWLAALPLVAALTALLLACGDGRYDSAEGNTAQTSTPASGVGTATGSAAAFPKTFTDSSGAQVTVTGPPRRIVSLSPGATEILFAIGAGERVVGSDQFSNYPEAAQRTAKLDYSSPNPERTLALNPDLVVMATRQREQVKQFRDLKLPVIFLEEASSVQGVLDQIVVFGQLTGQTAQAEALVGEMRRRIDAATSRVAAVTAGPRVFYELSPDLYTVAPDTFIGSMLSLLKAQNIARGATTRFPQLSSEAVISADPEVIVLADAGSAGQSIETLAARPGWSNVAAIKNRRVYAINPDIANRPGPRIVEAIEELARALYPDRR